MESAAFPDSYRALKTLHNAGQESGSRAPIRPLPRQPPNTQVEVNSYVDSSIIILAESTTTLYEAQISQISAVKAGVDTANQKIDRLDSNVDREVGTLSGRILQLESKVEEIRDEIEDVKTQVEDVKTQVEDVKTQVEDVKTQVEDVKTQVANIHTRFDNESALRANGFRKDFLNDRIEPVSAAIIVDNTRRYEVPPEFPKTVREFWDLESNIPALVKLAKHYAVPNWERWRQVDSSDTEFNYLDDAVEAYPQICLQHLANKWGLEYSYLPQSEIFPRKRKAEADSGSGSRKVRKKEDMEEERGSIISRDLSGRLLQQERITYTGPAKPVGDFKEVLEPDPPLEGQRRMSVESMAIKWKMSSFSTTDRQQFRDTGTYARQGRKEEGSGDSQC